MRRIADRGMISPRHRLCLLWFLPVLALVGTWPCGAGAQSSGSVERLAQVSSGAQPKSERNPHYDYLLAKQKALRERQTFFLRCLRSAAQAHAGGNRARFYAILRFGVGERGEADATGGPGTEPEPDVVLDVARLPLATVAVTPIDSDPAFQDRLERRMREMGATEPGPCQHPERIVAIGPAVKGAFPEVVGFVRSKASVRCSGVVVSKERRAVLTAAHCVCGKGIPLYDAADKAALNRAVSSMSHAEARARCKTGLCAAMGDDVAETDPEKESALYPIAGAVLLYRDSCAPDPTSVVRGKDVALVFLHDVAEPRVAVPSPHGLQAIRIDRWIVDQATYRQTASLANATLHVVGFGRTGSCPGMPQGENTLKRWAHVPVRSASCLNPQRASAYGCRAEREAVLISERRPGEDGRCMPDTCQGDSGGPVYWRDERTGYYFLAALTSRGLPGWENACGAGGIYSLVTPRVRKWMEDWGVKVNVRPTSY